jgi:hypothetical protein
MKNVLVRLRRRVARRRLVTVAAVLALAATGCHHQVERLGMFPGPLNRDIEANVDEWSDWLGRRPYVVNANQGTRSWSDYRNSCAGKFDPDTGSTLPGAGDFTRMTETVAITFGPLTLDVSSEDQTREGTVARRRALEQLASGTYDDEFLPCARMIVAAGHGDAIIRVLHEPDASYPWQARGAGGEPDLVNEYKAAFRHVVEVLRTVSPDFRYEYSLNGRADRFVELLYPGDDVVDIVGQDRHEFGRPVEESIARLRLVQEFAAAHGKAFSVPEWSVSVDGPDYVQAMHDFLASLPEDGPGHLAYHGYFQWGADMHLDLYPQAKQRFLELFGT